jgi:hypothetical protein
MRRLPVVFVHLSSLFARHFSVFPRLLSSSFTFFQFPLQFSAFCRSDDATRMSILSSSSSSSSALDRLSLLITFTSILLLCFQDFTAKVSTELSLSLSSFSSSRSSLAFHPFDSHSRDTKVLPTPSFSALVVHNIHLLSDARITNSEQLSPRPEVTIEHVRTVSSMFRQHTKRATHHVRVCRKTHKINKFE